MVIPGEWLQCEDGITRPTVQVTIHGPDNSVCADHFLVDTAADRSAFSAALLKKLRLSGDQAPPGLSLQGIGGTTPHVIVTTALEFTRDDGGPARVRGEFAAFTDPSATDFSILGRDVLDNFDVITSRRCNAVLLLAGNYRFQITGD